MERTTITLDTRAMTIPDDNYIVKVWEVLTRSTKAGKLYNKIFMTIDQGFYKGVHLVMHVGIPDGTIYPETREIHLCSTLIRDNERYIVVANVRNQKVTAMRRRDQSPARLRKNQQEEFNYPKTPRNKQEVI